MQRPGQVWKPLECAEMPRMAWKATGRPTIRSRAAVPAMSVQGRSSVISCSKATWASSAAMRRMVAAGMPQAGARPPQAQMPGRDRWSVISWNTGFAWVAPMS
jgi:hypothetical protein